MKSIAKLQQEIRSIRNEIIKLDARLEVLDSELLNYKDTPTENSEYKRIYEIAQIMPILLHPIVKETLVVKKNYFGILMMIVTVDDSINENQLLFLQRMVMSDKNNSRLDYYLSSMGAIHSEDVLLKMDEQIKKKYGKNLVLDMLLLSGLSKGVTKSAGQVIANIATFLGILKSDLQHIVIVAKAILTQNIDIVSVDEQQIIKMNELFGYYLSEIRGWNRRVENARDSMPKPTYYVGEGKQVSKTAFFHMSEEEEYGSDWYYYKD